MKGISKNKSSSSLIMTISSIVIVVVFIYSAVYFGGRNQQDVVVAINGDGADNILNAHTYPVLQVNKVEDTKINLVFNQISPVDKTRMTEIITGVMKNTTLVTPELKNELSNIFKKYNATNEEIDNFSVYGPSFLAVYQAYFFVDALQAVASGNPIKSQKRLNLENEAVSMGLMTVERVKLNDEEMKLIASHQSVTGSDGRQVIFTEDIINSTLNNIHLITNRLQSLFTVDTALNPNNNQPASGITGESSEDKGCESLHGPSVYKTYPQSLGGGAYCDCKPGYTSILTATSDGTPSSWCVKE